MRTGALIMLSEKQKYRKHCQSRDEDRDDDVREDFAAANAPVKNRDHDYQRGGTADSRVRQDAPFDEMIWHYRGQRWYANTKHGAFACEKEAGAAGARGTRNGFQPVAGTRTSVSPRRRDEEKPADTYLRAQNIPLH
jgi:hypothetical protein